MSMQDILKLDDEFIAAWNSKDTNRALALLSDDVVWNDVSIPQPLHGKGAVTQYMQNWFTPFPDMRITVKNRIATDDQIAAEVEFNGTHTGPLQLAPDQPPVPPTRRKVTGRGTYFVRFRGGKAVEIHTYPDTAGMIMQLGLMPMSEVKTTVTKPR
jgi:steroid delta-isomerase-like uncharacterized protein